MNCLIVCAAPITREVLARIAYFDYNMVIAADGGYLHCDALGIAPDAIIGDFDSAPLPPDGSAVVYPSHKDDTDCTLALREGIARGATDFLLLGCTGGRLDHTLAVIQSLAWLAEQGCSGTIVDEQHTLTTLDGGNSLVVPRGCEYLSVFALGERCEGVTLRGVEYPLTGYTLTNSFPLGVSNKITDDECHISLTAGRLLVVTVG